MMASVYFGCKGAFYQLAAGVQLPYFRSMGLDGLLYQTTSTVAHAPWAMKGLIGALSDAYPLGGYYKRYYMMGAAVLGSAAILCVALLPASLVAKAPWAVSLLFFCCNLQISTLDLLCEGKYAELMVAMPHTKSDVVTFVWMCVGLGQGLGSLLVGPISDYLGVAVVFWLCVPFAAQVLFPTAAGYLPEEPVAPALANKLQVEKISRQWKLFMLALSMAAGALGLAGIGLLGHYYATMVYSVGVSAVLCAMGFACLPRTLALCNLYMFLQSALYVSIAGAMDFWYTAGGECVADGPHFDYTYYNTYTQLIATAASSVGLWLFQTFLSDWPFRRIFWISTLLQIGASFFDLVMVRRWNETVLGVPDRLMYILGDAIIMPVCTMLNFMPSVVLTSKLCPKNMESTMYAILAGFANFGMNVSKSVGVFLIEHAGIKTSVPCNFDSLPSLIVVCHGLLPLLAVPLTFVLIPDVRMSENLLDDPECTSGRPNFQQGVSGDDLETTALTAAEGNGPSARVIGAATLNANALDNIVDQVDAEHKRVMARSPRRDSGDSQT